MRSPRPDAPPGTETARPNGDEGEVTGGSRCPVVGIGASAGGLEAATQFLSSLAPDTGMAYVLVQHLDPRHESRLPDLLARATRLPVLEATHGLAVRPDHVYVIPPNAKMGLAQGILSLSPRDEPPAPRHPIDYFFRCLAEDRREKSVAVVLSGTGSDGAQGVCEVKAAGGITFAQEEGSAAHAGMPHSAIRSGCVDFVLPPDQIARRLSEIGGHPYLAPVPRPPDEVREEEDGYRRILSAVRSVTGMDFSLYRDSTIKRRIMRRMAVHAAPSLAAYAERLGVDPAEVEALYHDLLIRVTSYFREPEMFEALKTTIFPELVREKVPTEPFRVWVPGCSTGQEAYSLAMTLTEFFDREPVRPEIQIFATDIGDETGLDKARMGRYPEGIEDEVSPERLRRFFHREDHGYRIDKSIRDMCIFAQHNVAADPPFSRVHLVSCRNVLIYLTLPLQRRVLAALHYALTMPGYLVLGSAETASDSAELFDLKDPAHRIYAKKNATGRHPVFFPTPDYRTGAAHGPLRGGRPTPTGQDFQREADRLLLGRYAPPGVLVDENFEIIQYRGRTADYLEPPPGEPTTGVLRMAREGLFLELSTALAEAKKHGRPVRREGIRLRSGGRVREIALEVLPLRPEGSAVCYLVLFPDAEAPPPLERPPEPPVSEGDASRELMQLRQELAASREYLQSMVEQQDAANAELRSANEEILSSNEELQSTNEELETAKEELQSANEELTTVNEQLQRRNLELDTAHSDMRNLLSSSGIPVVMVGADLRIRLFTPAAKEVLSLLPADVGRPVADLRSAGLVEDLEALIGEVIARAEPAEREVRARDGRWFVLRIHPYRATGDRIDGAVLVLVDVDRLRRDEESLRRQAALIELSPDAVIVRDARDRVVFWNRGAQVMYGWTAEEAKGRRLDALLQTEAGEWAELTRRTDESGTWEGELHQVRRDGTPLVVQTREVLDRDASGARVAVLSIARDVREIRGMMAELREAARRKDEFLATLAHELRNPLAPIRNAAEIIRRAAGDPAAIAKARDILDRQVQQLSRIVDDLVDVGRIVGQKIELHRERVPLGTVVETAVETCRSQIAACNQRLAVRLPDEPVWLDVDAVRISQVLVNLLTNASKYTPEGGKIWLTAERAPAGGPSRGEGEGEGELVLVVGDTGAGIPAELLPRVFEMFTQGPGPGPGSGNPGRSGLGVGLTLARSLVQMHGGSIEARSPGMGKGSEFIVRLPAVASPPTPVAGRPSRRPARPPRRIMVVEDNRDQLQSLGMLLKLMGHEVLLVENGDDALRSAPGFAPELALIDIGLPGMNGYELARRIRDDPQLCNMTLVAQTGWGQDYDRMRSREAGFDHHLVKPLTTRELGRVLNESRGGRPA